ncbi:MAG: hypothetical protein OHK0023_21790 [Anaerolineae bacterium]
MIRPLSKLMTPLFLHPKPPLDMFIKTCTSFVILESLATAMQARIQALVSSLRNYTPPDPIQNLAQLLAIDGDYFEVALALLQQL